MTNRSTFYAAIQEDTIPDIAPSRDDRQEMTQAQDDLEASLLSIFNDSDERVNLDPRIWGDHWWITIDMAIMHLPKYPDQREQKDILNFILSWKSLLPCEGCQSHFKKNLFDKDLALTPDVLSNRDALFIWSTLLERKIMREKKTMGIPCSQEKITVRTKLIRYRNFMEKRLNKIRTQQRNKCFTTLAGVVNNNYVFYGALLALCAVMLWLCVMRRKHIKVKI